MSLRDALWWTSFLMAGIWMQQLLPGIDALIIGLIIALQEGRIARLLWVLPTIILLQEGMGTLAFGSTLLWYGATIALFYMGRWLFEVENFVFVFLLSACLGLVHYLISDMMASLQNLELPLRQLMDESILQALFIPPTWRAALELRRRFVPDEHPL